MRSIMIKTAKIILRILAVILIGFFSAVIGLIAAANLAGIYELISGHPFVLNGRENYEAAGPIGFILGALIGLVASSVYLFGRRTKQ